MLGAEGDGGWGGRRGVCSQLQEGKNCISCVDTSTDCFLLHKHTHSPSVTLPTHSPCLFLCHTPTHNKLLRVTSLYLQGAGLVRKGPDPFATGANGGKCIKAQAWESLMFCSPKGPGRSPGSIRRSSSHADLGTRFVAPLR